MEPLVSIICTAYNHEPYIRECLDGFMMQETNFKFEILISDDNSTDKTADIIREYKTKYPDIFVPFYHKENLYSQGINFSDEFYSNAKGKYIATCEGDDYWIDPLKLQKQVDFLEANEKYVLTCHRVLIHDEENNISQKEDFDCFFKENVGLSFDRKFVFTYCWITHTSSLVFRKDKFYYENFPSNCDVTNVFYLLKEGLGYCFNEFWSIYRFHEGGVYSKQPSIQKHLGRYINSILIYESNINDKIAIDCYYGTYASLVLHSRGKFLFKDNFSFKRLISLFWYIPRKLLIRLRIKLWQ